MRQRQTFKVSQWFGKLARYAVYTAPVSRPSGVERTGLNVYILECSQEVLVAAKNSTVI